MQENQFADTMLVVQKNLSHVPTDDLTYVSVKVICLNRVLIQNDGSPRACSISAYLN